MKLSQDVKDFFNFINNRGECTIHDLIENFCTIKELELNTAFYGSTISYSAGTKVPSLENIEEYYSMIKTLKFICNRPILSKLLDIYRVETKQIGIKLYFTSDGDRIIKDDVLLKEVSTYEKTTYSRTEELREFVNNNYLTDDEIKQSWEMQRDIANGKLTRRMAYLSLLVSVLISIATSIFNYSTYTTIRNVNISSMPNNKEPIKIILVDENGKPVTQIDFSNDETIIIKK